MQNDKNTIAISKRSHLVRPPQIVARNQNMGSKWKTNWQNKWIGGMAMGKCEYWQRKSYIAQTNCKHSKRGYGKLPLDDVYTCMDFLWEHESLKKLIPKHYFTSLLKDLSMGDLVTLGNLLSTKFMEPSRRLYATPSRRAWVPQDLRNKMIKQHVNHWMIGLP
jgi:hypothetical protein